MVEETTHQAVCIQQQQIGEIKASLESRKEENLRIEGRLTAMVDMLTSSQLDQTKRDNDLKNELTKIATILNGEQERRRDFEQRQNAQKEDISGLQKDITEINNNIRHILELNNSSADVHAGFEKRIKHLEHVSIWVYAFFAVIGGIGIIIGYLFTLTLNLKELIGSREQKQEWHQIQRVEDHSSTTTTTTNKRNK